MEGFIIGSEFAQLTRVKDVEGHYPAVAELVKVAKQVKFQLGKEVNVTYAAIGVSIIHMMVGIIWMNYGLHSSSMLLA